MHINDSLKYLVGFKKALSRIAEGGGEEYETRDFIMDSLRFLGFSPILCAQTGVICPIDFGKEKSIAFRADMDALPLNGDYAHLCGHDAHMALLLAFAAHVAEDLPDYDCNILLIFQPAEETFGGAPGMIAEGILEKYNVAEIYGFHVFPSLPGGFMASMPGYMFSDSSKLIIRAKGLSAHAASGKEVRDALKAAGQIVTDINNIPPSGKALCRVCTLQAGRAQNIIADSAELTGIIRTLGLQSHGEMLEAIDEICRQAACSSGCEVCFIAEGGYIALKNDGRLYRRAKELFGKKFKKASPCFLADDFAFFARERPGLYMLLGVGEGGQTPELHSSDFSFNEKYLSVGLKAYITIAENAPLLESKK